MTSGEAVIIIPVYAAAAVTVLTVVIDKVFAGYRRLKAQNALDLRNEQQRAAEDLKRVEQLARSEKVDGKLDTIQKQTNGATDKLLAQIADLHAQIAEVLRDNGRLLEMVNSLKTARTGGGRATDTPSVALVPPVALLPAPAAVDAPKSGPVP